MPDYLLQEDNTSKIAIEDGTGFLILDTVEQVAPPGGRAGVRRFVRLPRNAGS